MIVLIHRFLGRDCSITKYEGILGEFTVAFKTLGNLGI